MASTTRAANGAELTEVHFDSFHDSAELIAEASLSAGTLKNWARRSVPSLSRGMSSLSGSNDIVNI